MNMSDLEKHGFYSVGGKIDRAGRNYGVLTKSGPVLTPEGDELYRQLCMPEMARTRRAKAAAVDVDYKDITLDE